MSRPRAFLLLLLLAAPTALVATPERAEAQLGRLIDKARKKVDMAKETVTDARALRCDARGICGEIRQAAHFAPESYESVAVTVFDGTSQFRASGIQGMVRDAFEGGLVKNGFLLAASSDAAVVREKVARGASAWTDDDLKQLKDFIHGIDAVIVVDIRQVDVGQCALTDDRRRPGSEATVHLSVRWLNPDAGDVPWVATHQVTVCEETAGAAAATEALESAAAQLAGALPVRKAPER